VFEFFISSINALHPAQIKTGFWRDLSRLIALWTLF